MNKIPLVTHIDTLFLAQHLQCSQSGLVIRLDRALPTTSWSSSIFRRQWGQLIIFTISPGGSVHTIDSPCTNLRYLLRHSWVYHRTNGQRRCNLMKTHYFFLRIERIGLMSLALRINGGLQKHRCLGCISDSPPLFKSKKIGCR